MGGVGGDAGGDELSAAVVVVGVSCSRDCKYTAGSVVSGVLGLPVLLRLPALSLAPLGVMEASVTFDTGDRELGKSGFGLGDRELLQGDARSPGDVVMSAESCTPSDCFCGREVGLEGLWFANNGFGLVDTSSPVPPSLLPLELGSFRLGAGVITSTLALESSSESEAQGSKGGFGILPLCIVFEVCTFPSVLARRKSCAPFSFSVGIALTR